MLRKFVPWLKLCLIFSINNSYKSFYGFNIQTVHHCFSTHFYICLALNKLKQSNVSKVSPPRSLNSALHIGALLLGADLYKPRCPEWSTDFSTQFRSGKLPGHSSCVIKFGKLFSHRFFVHRAVWGVAPFSTNVECPGYIETTFVRQS